jgi:hypothetical protein
MILVVWEYAQNTFLTTPDVQKYLFLKKSFWWCGSLRKCIKTQKPLQMLKNIFFKDMILVVWKYAKMHQNTFLTTPDGQKYPF